MAIIYGNMIGGASNPRVYQLEFEDGSILEGVVADEAPVLTATANDVRKGKTVITNSGVIEGEKDIPAYRTTVGFVRVLPGDSFSIPLPTYEKYDYTTLQCMLVKKNTTPSDSVFTDKIVIDDTVFPVMSTEKISDVTKNFDNKTIELNLTNNTEQTYYIRYYTYRMEE